MILHPCCHWYFLREMELILMNDACWTHIGISLHRSHWIWSRRPCQLFRAPKITPNINTMCKQPEILVCSYIICWTTKLRLITTKTCPAGLWTDRAERYTKANIWKQTFCTHNTISSYVSLRNLINVMVLPTGLTSVRGSMSGSRCSVGWLSETKGFSVAELAWLEHTSAALQSPHAEQNLNQEKEPVLACRGRAVRGGGESQMLWLCVHNTPLICPSHTHTHTYTLRTYTGNRALEG